MTANELRLTCSCGDSYVGYNITSDKAEQIKELWTLTHDGAVCFLAREAAKFWNGLKRIMPPGTPGRKKEVT